MHEMMARVLPKYFKHCKYTSFQRQLNYFSFRKWTKSKAVVCTFSNDFFLRDQPELAWRITRKKSLSPHAQSKYRGSGSTRASAVPYWKREPVLLQPPAAPHFAGFEGLMLPGYRLPYPSPADAADFMLKQQPSRCYGFNAGAPMDAFSLAANAHGQQPQSEPLDWIDCLLPPTDESYNLCMYPPAAAVAPYAMTPRKAFPEFVPSSL
jgi:hypothetical protein